MIYAFADSSVRNPERHFLRGARRNHRQPPAHRLRLGVSPEPALHAARRAHRRAGHRPAARRREPLGVPGFPRGAARPDLPGGLRAAPRDGRGVARGALI